MQSLPAAFNALTAYQQFILWRAVPRNDGTGKVDKFPVNPHTGEVSDAHDPAIRITADQAIAAAAAQGLNVGYVFTAADPFFFIDIDDCLEPSGAWSDMATYLCSLFEGAAVEISQSGQGLHIIACGQAPTPRRKKGKHSDGSPAGFDLYTELRFVALTGTGVYGDTGTEHSPALHSITSQYLGQAEHGSADWTDGPCEGWAGIEDDEQLLERMLVSRSAAAILGGRASVEDLWRANADALGDHYPHDQGLEPFDHSTADIALCQHLAFWTGKDCERIDRLFRLSALYRDKWEDREAYRRSTILLAVSRCTDVYSSRAGKADSGEAPTPVDVVAVGAGEIRTGFQYLAVTQQLELFAGCTYIRDLHRIFTPDGALLKSEQFNAMYGGYVFALDSFNDKTTKKSFEVFTESQALMYPKAHSICFRPELLPGEIIEEEGRKLVNTYSPIATARSAGDPTPFYSHLARLLPVPGDQAILMAYMAALVQYKGIKFQWAPLLQGVEGNGKTVFISCLAHAIGHRYTHLPDAADLGNKFNFWLVNKLFIGIEEIYVPSAKQEIMEALKPMITNSRMGMQGKGADQVTGDNRANFLLCCNPKEALRKTKNDRRYCIFYTAQQTPRDIDTAGMGGRYFPELYNWLRAGGYAVVNELLHTYAIPDALNPATDCHRAPVTSSTAEAIAVGMGGVEQELLEAIDEGRPGFTGGWISSSAFDRLIEDRRDSKRIPPNKRREILQGLGYDWHPALKNGRVNNVIPFDNGKPRLYILEGHISRNITKAAEATKAYLVAQGLQTDTGAGVPVQQAGGQHGGGN